jgi:hypothetical protein
MDQTLLIYSAPEPANVGYTPFVTVVLQCSERRDCATIETPSKTPEPWVYLQLRCDNTGTMSVIVHAKFMQILPTQRTNERYHSRKILRRSSREGNHMLRKLSIILSVFAALGLAAASPAAAANAHKTVHVKNNVHVKKNVHVNKNVHVKKNVHVNKNVHVKKNVRVHTNYVVGRRYNGHIWYGKNRHRWHGRWYAYGVGPCWINVGGLWFWNVAACPP